jgi:hypothetical protein
VQNGIANGSRVLKVWRTDAQVLTLHHQSSLAVKLLGVPLAVGTGFPIIDHGRPAQGEIAKTKDEAQLVVVQALRSIANPESRPLSVPKLAPVPPFVIPEAPITITASFDKLKILAICDGVLAGTKRWDLNGKTAVLHIPAVRGE